MIDPTRTLIGDTECYPNAWMIGLKRLSDGKVLTFEQSRRRELDRDRLRRIMLEHTVIGYNFLSYDHPMICEAINGASCAELKRRNDQIIGGNIKHWQVEDLLGYRPMKVDIIDLMDVQPNGQKKPGESGGQLYTSLKSLNGRMHGRWMQDLPYHFDQVLTDEEIEFLRRYMINDLSATELLYGKLGEPLALRMALGDEYGMDFRSKSDSQIGEAIVRRRVEQLTKRRVEKVETKAGATFRYQVPDYLRFAGSQLRGILDRLRETDFVVQGNGKVDLPKWLSETKVAIGDTTYAMGIGGLHSTEANRSVYSDAANVLVDVDVASYYPAIILGSGLYPQALGPEFLREYRKIRDERVEAKRAGNKVKAEGLKISLNGVFGKLGSRYSVLYAPHLMITVTLTGQLALLMLIERAAAAGIPAVSGNTDGVVFRSPRSHYAGLKSDAEGKPTARLNPSLLTDVVEQWERDTGFELEATPYRSLHSLSVNTYIAIKEDGKAKRKGTLANPWEDEKDIRTQLMKNPNMTICSDAVLAFIKDGVPLEETIRACRDVRQFVTVVNVQGGGTWQGEYLGKVVRYIWSVDGDVIQYKTPHASTGNFKKVPRTDGCRPLMTLPDELPADIDYARYVSEAREILMDLGVGYRATEVRKFPVRGWRQAATLLRALVVLD